jgi:hypothetical protein
MHEHERLSLPADEVAKPTAADFDEALLESWQLN